MVAFSSTLGSVWLAGCGGGSTSTAVAAEALEADAGNNAALEVDPDLGTKTAAASTVAAEAGALVAFSLRSPSVRSATAAAFCLGHAFRKGDIPAGSGVVASLDTVQVIPKNHWPDGSLKFAIISGRTAMAAGQVVTVSLRAGTPAVRDALTTANLRATGATASISASGFGTVSWSGADWDQPFMNWVAGPEMSSWIYRKPVGSDPHLVAWLEVRVFAGGDVEVLPWIENGYLRVAGPTNKAANYGFTLGKSSRFAQFIDLPPHCRTPLVNKTALSYWLRSDLGVAPSHDVAYLQATRMVPSYRAVVDPSKAAVGRLPTTYAPLQQGSYPAGMGSSGYHPSIGLLPEWDVLYLTTTAAAAWAALQINAYSAGRYGIHFRDETTNRPLRFSAYPNLVVGGGNGISGSGASTLNTYTPGATGTAPATYASSHHPSMGYMAYLVTGRWYHLETTQFVATTNYLKNTDWVRSFSQGVFLSAAGANTTRGMGWAIRSLAQAAAITPVTDPLAAEFNASLAANVDFNHARYVARPSNPQGWVQPYLDYTGVGDGVYFEATWMQDFVTAAFGYAIALELDTSKATRTRLSEFFAWKARSIVGRFGGTGDAEYLYRDAAQYTIAVAPSDTANWETGAGPWFADWGALYTATMNVQGSPGERTAGDLRGAYFPEATSYWGNLQPALAYAVEHGVPGSQVAYERMVGAGNWPSLRAAFDNDPVWSVKPAEVESRSPIVPVLPPGASALQAYVPAPGGTANVSLNSLSPLNPCPANNCWYSQASKLQAPWRNWSGAAWAPGFSAYGALVFWGGGHGGGEDVGLYVFDFTSGQWSRVGPDNPTTAEYTTQLDPSHYDFLHQGNNIVPALHSYNYPAYVPPNVSGAGPKGAWLLPQLVGGAGSGAKPHAVDLSTGRWSRFSTGAGASGQSPYAGSIEDTRRARVWWGAMDMGSLNMLDFNEAHPRQIHVAPMQPAGSVFAYGGYYARHVYVPEADMAVGFWCLYAQTRVRGETFDMSSGQPVRLGGDNWPAMDVTGAGFGVDWCPVTRSFYFYEGGGATRVLKLTPSSLEFHRCTWAWSEERINAPAWEPNPNNQARGGAQPMSKWRYIPGLRCFAWCDGPNFSARCADGVVRDGVMQLWRPLGT